MYQAVGEAGSHIVGDGAVLDLVSGGNHKHAERQGVPPDATFLKKAVNRGLQGRGCRSEFVQEQDCGSIGIAWQIFGPKPRRCACVMVKIWKSAQILRFDCRQAQIKELESQGALEATPPILATEISPDAIVKVVETSPEAPALAAKAMEVEAPAAVAKAISLVQEVQAHGCTDSHDH